MRQLTTAEQKKWAPTMNKSVEASPLIFSKAGEGGNDPYMIEVTNGQWEKDPSKPTLVIHVIKRSDIHPSRAVEVLQSALTDVFGRGVGKVAECDYRNVDELRKRLGTGNFIQENHDSMTVIFPPGPIVYTRKTAWVRDQMANAIRVWHERSSNW